MDGPFNELSFDVASLMNHAPKWPFLMSHRAAEPQIFSKAALTLAFQDNDRNRKLEETMNLPSSLLSESSLIVRLY